MSGTGSDTLIFISYSRIDTAFAENLKQALRQAGATIWIDHESLPPGDPDWQAAIRRGIEKATAMIYVGTPDAAQSPNVRSEIVIARSRKPDSLHIYPVWARGEQWSDCAPFELIPANAMDARGNKYSAVCDALLKALGLPTPGARPQHAHAQPTPAPVGPPAHPAPSLSGEPRFPAPIVPARLASLGYQGINVKGISAFVPPLVTIPAGPFIMGSDLTHDANADGDETPQSWIEVPTFQIAKYPVTVAEYALAERTGGVRAPSANREVNWARQQQHPDHPVVCVTWADAMTYVDWLANATGELGWRLPSEAEWEKAACWDAQLGLRHIYPWGDRFEQWRCNTYESGIKTTSPVGSYPSNDARRSGASPYGAEEMAGNVVEWTSSLYKPYPYMQHDGREVQDRNGDRTLRSGSWIEEAMNVRAASRRHFDIYFLSDTFGFRIVLGAPGPHMHFI